ncbi:MAG: glycosyltransferase family 39 protein [Thermoanaerobaculia bacterium]
MTRGLILAMLLVALFLASWGALTDSLTTDERSHLVSGMAPLVTGDFRMSPDHPPLARMWAALPLLAVRSEWPPAEGSGWHEGDFFRFGSEWLVTRNETRRLLLPPRAGMIAILLATIALTGALAARLFGLRAGLLALAAAALDPMLLGNGHLVLADVPLAAAVLAALLALQRFLERPGLLRGSAVLGALAAAALVKFSWPLVLPSLLTMAIVGARRGMPGGRRPLALLTLGAAILLPAAIWAAYGFRESAFAPGAEPDALMYRASDPGHPRPETMSDAWQTVLHDPLTAAPRRTAAAAFVRFAHERHLLPEAYLYGIAYVEKKATLRSAYLLGRHSMTGFRSYFPIAWGVKTPLGLLALFALGLAALVAGKARPSPTNPTNPTIPTVAPLATGAIVFVLLYGAAAIASHLNIGVRHLVPIEPFVLAIAGASAAWLATRFGRIAVLGSFLALFGATSVSAPHLLGFFNLAAGGIEGGPRFVADSNVDLGQDHERLRSWIARHPDEHVVLAPFDESIVPRDLDLPLLVSDDPRRTLAPLVPATYVVSVNVLLGIYQPAVRDAAWGEGGLLPAYRRLLADPNADVRTLDGFRRVRLLNRLAHRDPDDRVGASLRLFRLSPTSLAELLSP